MNWSDDQWAKIIWSDESRFRLEGSDGRALCPKYVKTTKKHGGGSVLIWACFTAAGVGPITVVDGNMGQDEYVNVLSSTMYPYLRQLTKDQESHGYIFQEDGASCHTGAYASWWMRLNRVPVMDYWPAQSPDLNPIEHLWDELERRLAKRRYSIRNTKQLAEALVHEWKNIPPEVCKNLVGSMRDRCTAVLEAGGGHTRY